MIRTARKLFTAAILAGSCLAAVATAQTVKINGTACTTGTVAFGNNEINVTATGSCISAAVAVPSLTSVTPNTSVAPGTVVTATGTNFAAGAVVTVGGVQASNITFVNSTSLTFAVPSVPAGTQPVVITVGGQSSTQNVTIGVIAVTPALTMVSPATVVPGNIVTVTGTNFAAGATATVNGISAPLTYGSSTSVTVLVPQMAAYPVASAPLIVTVGGQVSNALNLTVNTPAPTVSGVSPGSIAPNAQLTINGTGLAPGATVSIAGVNAPVVGTPTGTSMIVMVPSVATGAQVVTVTVGAGTATTAVTIISALPVPTVSACTGTVSGTMTVTGTNFVVGSTTVALNGSSVVTTAVTTTSITGTVPVGVIAGTAPVIVTASGQASSSFNCTISPASNNGGSIATDVQNNVIPIPSKVAGVAGPAHLGPMGANGYSNRQNAWEVSVVGRCASTTPAISKIWYHNLDYATYVGTNQVEYFGVNANEALVYSFIAPPEGTHGSMQLNESTIASMVPNFVSISTTPCDFDTTKAGVGFSSPYLGCYNIRNASNTTSYYSTNGAASGFIECKLTPGTRYYLNYRSWALDAASQPTDACLATTGSTGIPCGGLFTLK